MLEVLHRYVTTCRQNISIARNQGIKTARADIIAFLDYDTTIEAGWLDKMYATLNKSGADCTLSSISTKLETQAPSWDPDTREFVRDWLMPDNTLIPLTRTGKAPIVVSTNASIWRRQSCFEADAPFDSDFGLSGGEDVDLFLRLIKQGIKISWCGFAQCYEWVPTSRMQFRYLFPR